MQKGPTRSRRVFDIYITFIKNVKTRFLKIILDSDNDNNQDYGYSISKIEHVPYGSLQVLFPPYKKGK